MSGVALLLSVILGASALASNLKTLDDFHKESARLLQQAGKESTFSMRAKYLEKLSKALKSELAAYEKKYPDEGSDEEQNVSRFFHSLEPAFEIARLKTVTKQDCSIKRQWVQTNDRMGRPEQAALSVSAEETLRWINILCK